MKIRRVLVSSVAIFALVSVAAFAQSKTGKDTVKLTTAKGYQDNGSAAPAKDKDCAAKYKQYIGAPVTTAWDINPKTGMMSASSNFQNVDTKLSAMGLSSSYSFIAPSIPPELQKIGVTRIIFQLSKTFTSPKSMIMFPLETGFNCVLSNGALSATTAKDALTGKAKE